MRRRDFFCGLFSISAIGCAKEDPNERANAAFVEAMKLLKDVPMLDTQSATLAYRKAMAGLDSIATKYPTSNLAVQLSTGQQIGDFRRADIERKLLILSGSMRPTLSVNDSILVLKYDNVRPKPGHIVVYRLPSDGSIYVQRLIAMANERVQMIKGALHLNGQAVMRERMADFEEKIEGATTRVKRWRETLPTGESYETLDLIENGFFDDTAPITVSAGHFFVMGDNRDNSTDSRVPVHGEVPNGNLIGRAVLP